MDKPVWAKTTDEMNLKELCDWARGVLLLDIGEGKFHTGVWNIMQAAYSRGKMMGIKEGKSNE